MQHLCFDTIRQKIQAGSLTVTALVENYLDAIYKKNDQLNIYLEVFGTEAQRQAGEIDQKIKAGTAGKLAGMVVAIKDNICYKNHKVSAASKILEGFESVFSATVIERLLAEDAIIIGRTNCDEFAMGSSNENSAFGSVKHPLDEERVPGGSSGGSVAAVLAGMCTVALGSETGGSVRQPASFCGLVGLKPTYGRVSRYGLIAYASSFDQISPVAHTVDDIALIMQVISGKDTQDSTSSSKPVEIQPLKTNDHPLKIAVLKDCLETEGIDEEIKAYTENTIEQLRDKGHTVEVISFPMLKYLVPTYYILTTAEASSNLARFDGVHYGYRNEDAQGVEEIYVKSRSKGFGVEVKRRIMLGTFVLSSGYYDAYYSKAQKVRRMVRDETLQIFQDYDFIITPTTPGRAFKFGEKSENPVQMYLEDLFTVQANIAGVPAVSIPAATKGLPFGIQIMAAPFKEREMLGFAKSLQSAHSGGVRESS